MTQRKLTGWLALLGLAIAAGLWWPHGKKAAPDSTNSPNSPNSMAWSLWPSQLPHAAPTWGAAPHPPGMPPEATRPVPSPLDTIEPPVCRAHADGSLVIDQQTRTDVERLHALYEGAEAQQKLQTCATGLPVKAQRELKDLYQHFAQYSQALTQAYPPTEEETSLDEARAQLVGISALRRQHFGVDGAKAMFGQEENIAQDLLNRIAANKDPDMTFEEKVNKAQEDQNTQANVQ